GRLLLRGGSPPLRGGRPRRDRPRCRHPHLRLQPRRYTEGLHGARRSLLRPRPPGLLRGESEWQPRRSAGTRVPRGGGRHCLRRGALPGDAGRVRPEEGRLRGRREDRGGAYGRAR
ncbi:MAG: Diaminopimelate decarboxylase, partial [uncultured Rubrobacteraceae bacterium]